MTTAVIVQARLCSTRLPGKVLLPLPSGRTVLEECLYRCRKIKGVDVVVAAIADDSGSDILHYELGRKALSPEWEVIFPHNKEDLADLHIVRGPEHDVLARYVKAAEAVNADVILRVTSDCPLIDPAVCAEVLRRRELHNVDYACNNMPATYPHGYDCEAFTIEALRRANEPQNRILSREHVTCWMRTSPEISRFNLSKPGANESHIRVTLDTIQDYVDICAEMSHRAEKIAA